jgi:prephenate dehydrogenase
VNSLSTIQNLCLVGVGLIGGSFTLALKNAGFTGKITGVVRSADKGEQAVKRGIIDVASTDIKTAVADCDLVMLAVPMLSMREQLAQIAPVISAHTIVTDAGSVKQPFIKDAKELLPHHNRIVPGHPIAGREKSGLDAIDAKLYQQHRVILTPLEQTDADAVQTVQTIWEMVGAEVECLTAAHHDDVLAATSHLPHVLAYATVDMLATRQEAAEIFRYAAGGFKDFTRIASGDPIMWRDICLTNRGPISDAIGELQAHLEQLQKAIAAGDADGIEEIIRRARTARETHIVNR